MTDRASYCWNKRSVSNGQTVTRKIVVVIYNFYRNFILNASWRPNACITHKFGGNFFCQLKFLGIPPFSHILSYKDVQDNDGRARLSDFKRYIFIFIWSERNLLIGILKEVTTHLFWVGLSNSQPTSINYPQTRILWT